jgi:hypothetical protein
MVGLASAPLRSLTLGQLLYRYQTILHLWEMMTAVSGMLAAVGFMQVSSTCEIACDLLSGYQAMLFHLLYISLS